MTTKIRVYLEELDVTVPKRVRLDADSRYAMEYVIDFFEYMFLGKMDHDITTARESETNNYKKIRELKQQVEELKSKLGAKNE